MPMAGAVMTYLKGLRRENLIGAAFGSYGWSGEGPKHVHAMLEEMNVDLVADPLTAKYVPDASVLADCRRLGLDVAAKLKDHVAAAV